jgi:SAM-dependent methyltransferase
MRKAETIWLSSQLERFKTEDLSPILDIGSSTQEFREFKEPWMQNVLFNPVQNRGIRVIHCDIKEGNGIDITADIFNDSDFERLKALQVRTVFCCNMMEHVLDPKDLAQRCWALVPKGGYIVVTVPYSYPFHRDPIDTMFRPRSDEIISLFHDVEVIAQEIIPTGSYIDHIKERPWIIFRHIFRFPFPFIHFELWKRSMRKLYWLLNPYQHSCVIMRKTQS